MKKILIALFLLPSVTLLNSCIKDAEVTAYMTEDKKDEIAKDNPDKVFAATVAGMYNDFQQYVHTDVSHNYFGQRSFDYLTSLMGNDMIMTGRFGMSIYHHMLDYRGHGYTPTSNRWREYYRVIDNANQILASIDPATTDPAVLKYKAIALGFRGYAYAQLSYLYQYSYYVGVDGTKWGKGKKYDYSESPSVPIVTDVITGMQPRGTVKEVHKQIVDDLEEAYRVFAELGMIKTAAPTDMDGCVVAMYLARAYMVNHEWATALKYAQIVINNFEIMKGEPNLTQGFSSIMLPDVVFGSDITSDNSTTYMSYFSQMDAYSEGYAGIGVWRAGFKPLVDRIPDSDVRLKWFCCKRTGVNDKGQTLLRDTESPVAVEYQAVKFIGTGRENIKAGKFTGWELGDYIYLRAEEAYMMKIEILAHQDNAEAVTELVNFVKTRNPNYSYTFTDKAALLEEIIFQKRVEFWGEGIEYLDNRRLNIPVDRTDATWGTANNHFSGARFKAEQEDIRFLYQLPDSEIENNPQIGPGGQNP